MKIIKQSYVSLVFLFLLFALPGVAAYYYYTHPQWLGASTTNKGKLLKPALLVPSLAHFSKWQLLLWYPKPCKEDCINQLDKLARIRLALGRNLSQCGEILAQPQEVSPPAFHQLLVEKGIHSVILSPSASLLLLERPQVFIVSPEHYLILAYDLTVDSHDIFQDLRKLLGSSEKSF